jgi:hypothetical protein
MSDRRPVTICVLSKYKDIFTPFWDSVKKFVDSSIPVIIVTDGNEIPYLFTEKQGLGGRNNYSVINGPEKFSMAGNGNLALKAVPKDHDILYVGDDVRFLEENTIEVLQQEAYKAPTVGILSPKIVGRGSPSQTNPSTSGGMDSTLFLVRPIEMWFPCVYIKRELIEKIGYLDEQFSDFGCDDFDYCIRTLLAGYQLAVTNRVSVQHEASPEGGPTTFVKTIGVQNWRKQEGAAQKKVCEKYSLTQYELQDFFNSGDISIVRKKSEIPTEDEHTGMECPQEQAAEFLKTKSLFIATPVYGGNSLTVNYTQSLISLINMCHNLGITYRMSFMYNESLITRARNKMVADFRKTDCTHFLFIDADIGFDARDIVMLMLQKEEVIGAPCVRKNIRWDRVASLVKKNGKDYTADNSGELQKVTGEFVVNFPHNKIPSHINLGQMLEVSDVGTGLLMVKREVFEKVVKAFPNDHYLQLQGEDGGRQVLYMFFQAGMDEDSRSYNPEGLPDYIPEDYAFVRKCRKAGIRIWMAPWMKTDHFGTFLYQGDLQAVAASGGKLR